MNVKYYNLYREIDGPNTTFYIPIRESDKEYATQGFAFTRNWEYNPSLVSPEDWDEDEFLKLTDITKTPKKDKLIKYIFEKL